MCACVCVCAVSILNCLGQGQQKDCPETGRGTGQGSAPLHTGIAHGRPLNPLIRQQLQPRTDIYINNIRDVECDFRSSAINYGFYSHCHGQLRGAEAAKPFSCLQLLGPALSVTWHCIAGVHFMAAAC